MNLIDLIDREFWYREFLYPLVKIRQSIPRYKKTVLIAFSIYIMLIFLFGYIYGSIYLADRKSFYFSGAISSYTNALSTQRLRINILNKVSLELQSISKEPIIVNDPNIFRHDGFMPNNFMSVSKVSTPHYEVTYQVHIKAIKHLEGAGGRERSNPMLWIRDKNGKTVDIFSGISTHIPRTMVDFTKIIEGLISHIKEDIDNYARLLKSLDENFPEAERVSYLDFLYFSAITQVTVGYGDILPNNSLVRFFVIVQIVIATGFLVIIIPEILSSTPSHKKSDK